jgi:hypothetical protein
MKCFQDAAGTIPADKHGDPIGRIVCDSADIAQIFSQKAQRGPWMLAPDQVLQITLEVELDGPECDEPIVVDR